MKTILEKKQIVDDEYTIYTRLVKMTDGSHFYQVQQSTEPNFHNANKMTFVNRQNAQKFYDRQC